MNYHHFWEQPVYGVSRYWLNSESLQGNDQMRRNFTRRLTWLVASTQQLRVEYELGEKKFNWETMF